MMIVQRVPMTEAPIIIRNVDHAVTALALARHFGNDHFAAPHPGALMRAVSLNHEEGWREFDNHPARNPETGLPFHLQDTPLDLRLMQFKASTDFNEKVHPWCGLLSSIHVWGYSNADEDGAPENAFEQIPDERKSEIAKLRHDEAERQKWLMRRLRRKRQTAAWVEPNALRISRNLLNFFDRLSLHFQLAGEGLRQDAQFSDVPTSVTELEFADVSLTMTGLSQARLKPYPFTRNPLFLRCRVRRIWPSDAEEEFQQQLKNSLYTEQCYRLSG